MILSIAASFVLAGLVTWRALFGAKKNMVIASAILLTAVASACVVALDMIDESRVKYFGMNQIFINLGCIALVTIVAWLAKSQSKIVGSAWEVRRHAFTWGLIALSIGMAGWSYHRFHIRNFNYLKFGFLLPVPGTIEPEMESVGRTDSGRPIKLYRFATDDSEFSEYAATSENRFGVYCNAVIPREAADKNANCHGWVFTGGKFLLRGDQIDMILQDNQYEQIMEPLPGDIVIYRDELGGIRHTGLVQAVLMDGTIITESKWGIDSRFLHRPEDQPYSKGFCYYRTSRPGHQIWIETTSRNEGED